LIVFDFRRYQRHAFELTRHAHARGAMILVITDPWFSQAAEVANLVLPVTVDGLRPFDSVVPATAIVESLVNLGKALRSPRLRPAVGWPDKFRRAIAAASSVRLVGEVSEFL
jgi:DNA-binding MurR/RpiR family transcriptional regulator